MNAVIDIGNTRAKIGLFEEDNNLEVSVVKSEEIGAFLKRHKVINALISNVSKQDNFLKEVENNINRLTVFTIDTPMPIITLYETPKSLGVDRLAACVGAKKYASGNILVIDVGSCITYDMLSHKNEHLGGLISPGIKMRLKSMHTFTSNLPLVLFNLNYS